MTSRTMPDVRVRPARHGEETQVSETLAAAFLHGDLADWLIPDLEDRRRVYPHYFRIFADHFLAHGLVETTDDLDAVALWWPVADHVDLDIADYDERLARVCGPAVGRFVALDLTQQTGHRAVRPHDYLAFLAVHPDRQGRRLGTTLLRHHQARLDTAGLPAYLEATGDRTRTLYRHHGFHPDPPITIPGGPALHPMWREPQP